MDHRPIALFAATLVAAILVTAMAACDRTEPGPPNQTPTEVRPESREHDRADDAPPADNDANATEPGFDLAELPLFSPAHVDPEHRQLIEAAMEGDAKAVLRLIDSGDWTAWSLLDADQLDLDGASDLDRDHLDLTARQALGLLKLWPRRTTTREQSLEPALKLLHADPIQHPMLHAWIAIAHERIRHPELDTYDYFEKALAGIDRISEDASDIRRAMHQYLAFMIATEFAWSRRALPADAQQRAVRSAVAASEAFERIGHHRAAAFLLVELAVSTHLDPFDDPEAYRSEAIEWCRRAAELASQAQDLSLQADALFRLVSLVRPRSPDDPDDDWERAIDAHRRLADIYGQLADHSAQWTILLAKARLIDRHTFQTTPYRPSNRARAFLEPFAARLETIQPATESERLTLEYLTRNVRRVLERELP